MGGVRIDVQTILRSAGFVDQEGGQEGECGEEADEEALHCPGSGQRAMAKVQETAFGRTPSGNCSLKSPSFAQSGVGFPG